MEYQVLCDETAMVAVIRDLNSVTGKLETYEMTQASTLEAAKLESGMDDKQRAAAEAAMAAIAAS